MENRSTSAITVTATAAMSTRVFESKSGSRAPVSSSVLVFLARVASFFLFACDGPAALFLELTYKSSGCVVLVRSLLSAKDWSREK